MTLYTCWCKYSDHTLFVFARNSNEARQMACEWEQNAGNYDATYEDIHYTLVGHSDQVTSPVVISDTDHPYYKYVEEMGFSFDESEG